MEQRDYVRRLLDAYRTTPGTCGAVRRPDRLLAAQLHQRGVPLEAVENALTLAAARRLARHADAPPLAIIRSLAYFSPVIEEVLICASASQPSPPDQSITSRTHAYGVDDVDCSVPSFLRSPTNLRAYGADDDKAHPAISVLYSVRVTLTNHYWVTSDERRRS